MVGAGKTVELGVDAKIFTTGVVACKILGCLVVSNVDVGCAEVVNKDADVKAVNPAAALENCVGEGVVIKEGVVDNVIDGKLVVTFGNTGIGVTGCTVVELFITFLAEVNIILGVVTICTFGLEMGTLSLIF